MRACIAVAVLAVVARGRGAAAFGQMGAQGDSIEEQCAMGLQGLPKACGEQRRLVNGQVAPPAANCDSGVCQQAVLAWWPMCKGVTTYSTIDNVAHVEAARR